MTEREITEPVSLTLPDGRLNPDAVGWTRTPLITTDGIGRGRFGRGRNKRWEYWAVTTPTHVVALVTSDIDYAAVHGIWVLDRRTGEAVAHDAIGVLGRSATAAGHAGCRAGALAHARRCGSRSTRWRAARGCAPRATGCGSTSSRTGPPGHECLGRGGAVERAALPVHGQGRGPARHRHGLARRGRPRRRGRRVLGDPGPRARALALRRRVELGRGLGPGRRPGRRGPGRRPVDRRHRLGGELALRRRAPVEDQRGAGLGATTATTGWRRGGSRAAAST